MNAQIATILIKYPKRNIMKCFFKARLFAFSPLKKIFFEICPCAVISVISFGRILSSWKPLSVHATHCAPTGGPRFLQTDRIQQFQNKTSQTSLTQSFHACHKGTPLWKSLHFFSGGLYFLILTVFDKLCEIPYRRCEIPRRHCEIPHRQCEIPRRQ